MDHTGSLSSTYLSGLPVRSPRTSLVLAELTRQRRFARAQRRMARRRWNGWLRSTWQTVARVITLFAPPESDRQPRRVTGDRLAS